MAPKQARHLFLHACDFFGVYLYFSHDNIIYHNNFVDNPEPVFSYESTNVWDDGYPSGGNHWSDYVDVDLYSGPYQNETGSDGIWDHPYVIDANNTDNYPLTDPYKGHNIAIVNIEVNKTIVGQRRILRIDVEVANIGSFPQTSNVTVYANSTETNTQIVTLAAGNSTKLRFHWNTTGVSCGNYTISAYATQVLGEIDIDDNMFTFDGTVFVTITGDVNCDGMVDASDLFDLSKVYGSNYLKPNWDSNYDFNDDGKVDASDLFELSRNFGETAPEGSLSTLMTLTSIVMALVACIAVPKWSRKRKYVDL